MTSGLLERADLRTLWLLGDPVSHSLSPLIQNTALQALGENLVYLAARVKPEELAAAVQGLVGLGALGANVTVPHKQAVLELCHEVSDQARVLGAVNVLKFQQGRVVGDNTDGRGWWQGLVESFGTQVHRRPAVVLGAGGAARAVVHTLADQGCPSITVLNRTTERARRLCQEVEALGVTAQAAALKDFADLLAPDCLVVQTTSAGLKGRGSPVELPRSWPPGAVLSELIYGAATPLLRRVSELGGACQDGAAMLAYQAAWSLALWLDRSFEEIPAGLMLERLRGAAV